MPRLQNIMSLQKEIETKLQNQLHPSHLQVINESALHSVPEGAEMHFKVIVVSQQFDGKSLVNRHRMINDLLKEELKGAIHALTMTTLTPAEWEKKGEIKNSPLCLGGSKLPAF